MLTLPRGRKVGPAIFDRRNQELTQGLISYYPPVLTGPTGLQLLDLFGESPGTLTGMDAPTDWVDSQHGKVLDFDGVNDLVSASSRQPITTFPFTLESWALLSASPSFSVTLTVGTSNNQYFSIGFQNSSSAMRVCLVGRNTTFTPSAGGPAIPLNTWNHVVGVFDSATSRAAYLNGQLVHNTSTSIPGFSGSGIRIGSAFNTLFHVGQIASSCIWNRALTPSEIQTLYRLEPGGLGRRLRDDFFLYETAITYLIEASTASYALTGQPIPLLYGRVLPADTGSVLLSGQTTPLLTSRLLNADQGSYAYSGTDAATLLGRLLDAGAAAYTLDGTAAGFLASRRISAETVAYLASGLDTGFLRSRVLEAGTGQYVLVASPVNLQTGTGGAAPYYYLFLLGGSR